MAERKARVERNTLETQITVEIDLDEDLGFRSVSLDPACTHAAALEPHAARRKIMHHLHGKGVLKPLDPDRMPLHLARHERRYARQPDPL